MERRVFTLLLGTMFIYYQVYASQASNTKIHFGEISAVSNITISSASILATWTRRLQIHDVHLYMELVAECVSVGDKLSCNCSDGYVWTNRACYVYTCCSESTCTANVTHLTPLCIPKLSTPVILTVKAKPAESLLSHEQKVINALGGLNGIGPINKSISSSGEEEFKADLSVRPDDPKLQEILTNLSRDLGLVLQATTQGMVVMETPNPPVHYLSTVCWRCFLKESSERSGFTLIQSAESSSELGNGKVVQLSTCTQANHSSCLQLELQEVTDIWSGQYQCGFTVGSVTHLARGNMTVETLPDEIIVTHEPRTADCSKSNNLTVNFTVNITESKADYKVSWSYSTGGKETPIKSTSTSGGLTTYKFSVTLLCKSGDVEEQFVNVTFKNRVGDIKRETTIIPVIYEGTKFCPEEQGNYTWPKTPDGATVVTRTCPPGRVGKKSRTCVGKKWQDVFSECVNEELSKVVNLADNALKGLGVTQTVVGTIFKGLRNTSTDEKSNDIADVSASISVLNKMSQISTNFPISEDALPDMVAAASNMLNKTWKTDSVNLSFVHQLSAVYLHSVEDLVKNININGSKDVCSENLETKSCSGADCNVALFGVSVNLTSANGSVKTFAARNLMDKLKNDYGDYNSVLLSATLTDSRHTSNLTIRLNFPKEAYTNDEPHCVFWNTSASAWSEEGCLLISHDENGTLCECDHLTSFAVIMSRSKEADEFLEMATTVGLGVSVCCLAVFLVVEALVWPAVVRSNLSLYRHTCMVNIATFLLLADVSFLASAHAGTLSEGWCLALTVCKHLFFLAMFCWMMCLSLMLVHQLVFVFNPLRKRVFMLLSGFIGYVCPVVTVGGCYFYYKSAYFDRKYCWLKYERLLVGSMHAFFIPVGIIIITNIFAMVVVILSLLKSSATDGTKDDKDTLKGIMKVIVLLMPVFGVTWVFGLMSFVSDTEELMHTIAAYAFTILNSLQGLFILLEGVFAEKKVRMELLRIVTPKTKRNEDSMKTSTTKTK